MTDQPKPANVPPKEEKVKIPKEAEYQMSSFIPEDQRITFTWNQINCFTKEKYSKTAYLKCQKKVKVPKKQILKNVSGVAYPGEMVALMGASGAGKSTLLNYLTFRCPRTVSGSGLICINGVPITEKTLTNNSVYVQQDDLFFGTLTVKEHLIFQAMVRMDRRSTAKDRMKRVNEVIIELALARCQDSPIGSVGRKKGISGGEKKRLSVASEILTNPKLMFCDEPTSGLDSFMANMIVHVLKNMALSGKTIITTIHQPSSEAFWNFDKLLLMAEGRIAFLGTPAEASTFFERVGKPCPRNYNPADHYIQVLAIVPDKEEQSRATMNNIANQFQNSPAAAKIAKDSAVTKTPQSVPSSMLFDEKAIRRRKPGCWRQFRAVLWRTGLTTIREPQLIRLSLLQTTFVALIIGCTYYGQEMDHHGAGNMSGALFVLVVAVTIQNLLAVLNIFCAELEIFLREHDSNLYRTDIYFICKTICESPVFLATPLILAAICYPMIGFVKGWDKFFICYGLLTMVGSAAISCGYFVSCCSADINVALMLSSAFQTPLLLLGGFVINLRSIPDYLEWISYLSWFRFGTEALMINQWDNTTIECGKNPLCPKTGNVILEDKDFLPKDFYPDIMALAGLIIGYRLVAFVILVLRTTVLKRL